MNRTRSTTLGRVISDDENFLESHDITTLVYIFGHRCHEATKDRLRKILGRTNTMQNHEIYEHVYYDPGSGWSHAAGPDPIESRKKIREKILGAGRRRGLALTNDQAI